MAIAQVATAPDGKLLALARTTDKVTILDVATGVELMTFLGHKQGVVYITLAADCKTLATVDGANTVRLWDVATGKVQSKLQNHQNFIRCLSFSPDGTALALGGIDSVWLWKVGILGRPRKVDGPSHFSSNNVFALAGGSVLFSPMKNIALSMWDKTVRLYDVATSHANGCFSKVIQIRLGQSFFLQAVRRWPQVSADTTILIWSVPP